MRLASAQDVDPEVRRQAMEDVHGPDLEGKDGPLAKVGLDLALLYREWQQHRQAGAEGTFAPRQSSLPVRDGRVTVDATAVREAAVLQAALEELGLEDAARAGRLVSGRLPIAAIPEAARLSSLQSMRPARSRTHRAPFGGADSVAARPAEAPAPESSRTRWYVVGGAAAAAVAAVAFFLFR